jgi:hypothetical protein
MGRQFREGLKYSGEIFYGGCGSIDINCITVLKRDVQNITYQENFGKVNGKIVEAPIQTIENWGEYVAVGDDRFFAYSVYND